jgi:ankyrin repeat protein
MKFLGRTEGSSFVAKFWILLLCWFFMINACATEDVAAEKPKKAYTGVTDKTQLFSHILKKEWNLALERLEEEPAEASILIERRDTTGSFVLRHMALHQVFAGDLPQDVYGERHEMSSEQLQVIKALFHLNPRVAVQKDLKKRTLLHLALASQVPPPVEVINALIRVNPHALRARDEDDRLPLHAAVASPMTSFANAEAVVNAYTGATEITDREDALPIHLAAWGGDGPDALPVIQLLINTAPSTLLLRDGDDETVLTLMAKYGRTSSEAIGFVIQQDPKAVFRDRDEKQANTPLHYAVSSSHGENSTIYAPILKSDPTAAEKINRVGLLPLHVALGQCCVSFELVQDLINAFPRGAALRDGGGFTPLHHASQVGSDIRIVKLLLEKAPKTVKHTASVKGRKGPLPLHLALSSDVQTNMMNEIILLLLKEYPDAALVKDPESGLASLPIAIMKSRSVEILRKLMMLDTDAVSQLFEIMEDSEPIKTSALHLLASMGPTYLNEGDITTIVKEFLIADPDGVKRKDGKGRTPLHIVWKDSLDDIKMTTSRQALYDALLDAYPEGAQISDDQRRLPVAYASTQRDDVAVSKLLDLYPFGASIKSAEGSFPLHYACGLGKVRNKSDRTHEIIKRLLQEYPQAASQVNNEGELPLHKVCESTGPDHILSETIALLLEANPESSRRRDRFGNLPLHIAVNNVVESDQPVDAQYWMGLITILLESYPEAASEGDKHGRTPFLGGIQLMDTLSPSRRQEDDPVLEILQTLYDLNPQSVLEKEAGRKTALHSIATLFGDVGGMLPKSWKDFAIRVMHDYPELLTRTDKSARTPLHLYILFLGDTAFGARENQDPKTMEHTVEIQKFLHTMVALNPDAVEMREEYGLTPLDLINHKRLSITKGPLAYNTSPIIPAVKRLLQRDEEYWEIAGDLERAKIAIRAADSSDACDEIQAKLISVQQRLKESLDGSDIKSSEPKDNLSCAETGHQPENCPEQILLIDRLADDLALLATANHASLAVAADIDLLEPANDTTLEE